MIKINCNEYNNNKIKVTYGNYSITKDGKKRKGKSPFISFQCNNIYIGIETIYDKTWLDEIKINTKKDITKYISDITCEDEKGWLSLIIYSNYNCILNKIGDKLFNIELICSYDDTEEKIEILINENINT